VRERYGTVRVSTAYAFFQAVDQHLEFSAQNYERKEKPPFEATGYKLYYYAADQDDETGKRDVAHTLDRKQMWDCTAIKETNRCYEFVGLPPVGDVPQLSLRYLPCPCECCRDENYGQCGNAAIVGEMKTSSITFKQPAECPDRLETPLNQYINDILRAFIKMYENKVPARLTTKAQLVKHILDNHQEFVHVPDDANLFYDD
jgi:hypothetical protein